MFYLSHVIHVILSYTQLKSIYHSYQSYTKQNVNNTSVAINYKLEWSTTLGILGITIVVL